MNRLNPWMFLAALLVLGLWLSPCEAAGGGGGGGGRGGGGGGGGRGGGGGGGVGGGGLNWNNNQNVPEIPAVEWSGTIQEAQSSAQQSDKPYLLYFCTEEAAKYVGTGSVAMAEYRKTVKNAPNSTAFENAAFVDSLKTAGYPIAKIAATPQTAEVAKKYRVTSLPTMVACAPGGEIMGMLPPDQCTYTNMLAFVKGLKERYEMWKKANPPKKDVAKDAAQQPAVAAAADAPKPPAEPKPDAPAAPKPGLPEDKP